MSLRIYNTLSKNIENFTPIHDKKVNMYACGITVYDESHIGHGSQAIIFDVIRTYLEYRGYDVTYVRNFTDIDDKIIKKANESNKTALEISSHYIEESISDLAKLKVRAATHEPKVSEHIRDIIDFISGLIEKGFAYVSEGEVLFDTRKFSEYGKLSKRNIEDQVVQEESDEKIRKRHPADFALWKPAKPGEPAWDSPWSKGRPGWHIECSVMAYKYLGETLDIHGGGYDLVFPHHENEIAQSEAYTGKPFSKYWVHNGLVMVNKQKMSKSLGNFYTIKDILKLYQPDIIRFVVLSFHYSSSIDFSIDMFKIANKRVYYFYSTLQRILDLMPDNGKSIFSCSGPDNSVPDIDLTSLPEQEDYCREVTLEMKKNFIECMDDNFNTARVIALYSDIFKKINDFIDSGDIKNKNKICTLGLFYREFLETANVLNMLNENPSEFIDTFKNLYLKNCSISKDEILDLIEKRNEAKKKKDYGTADKIRLELGEKNILLQDTPKGTVWSIQF